MIKLQLSEYLLYACKCKRVILYGVSIPLYTAVVVQEGLWVCASMTEQGYSSTFVLGSAH